MEHATEVRFQRGWGEYLPTCSCGWAGSYCEKESWADHEAAQHEANPPKREEDK